MNKGDIFDSSFARDDKMRRARHGLRWTESELATLKRWFLQGVDLERIAINMMRPSDGVLSMLSQNNLIRFDQRDMKYHITRDHTPLDIDEDEDQPQPKEPTMATPIIETKTFIQGEDAANLTDDQIYAKIVKLQDRIAGYDKIANKPKKLQLLILDLIADIGKLVRFVDSRP